MAKKRLENVQLLDNQRNAKQSNSEKLLFPIKRAEIGTVTSTPRGQKESGRHETQTRCLETTRALKRQALVPHNDAPEIGLTENASCGEAFPLVMHITILFAKLKYEQQTLKTGG